MTMLLDETASARRKTDGAARYESFTVHGLGSSWYDGAIAVRRLATRVVEHDPAALVELHAQLDRSHLLLSGRIEAREVATVRIRQTLAKTLEGLRARTGASLELDHAGLRRAAAEHPLLRAEAPLDAVASARAVAIPATDLRPIAESVASELAAVLLVPRVENRPRARGRRSPSRAGSKASAATRGESLRLRLEWDGEERARISRLDVFMPPWWRDDSAATRDRFHQAAWTQVRRLAHWMPQLETPASIPIRLRPIRLIDAEAAIVVAGGPGGEETGGGLPMHLLGCGPSHPARAGWWVARSLARHAVNQFGGADVRVRVGIDEGERRYRVEAVQGLGDLPSIIDLTRGLDLTYASAVRASREAEEASPHLAHEMPRLLEDEESEA